MICFCAERFQWRLEWQRLWQNPGELLPPGLSDMATRALLY
ncbi:MAG TPA: metal-dependent hydrolase, partial [Bradyrhizobium sp.]|nr:metal-dependent hydrolase [Bradyrhizobium sp.]